MFRGETINRVFGVAACLLAATVATEAGAHAYNRYREAHRYARHAEARFASAEIEVPHVIQCVAFAKQDAGIEISGNARDWWSNAAGIYERGSRPEGGSVLSFRENGRMPLGHVAVVSAIEDSRTIVIDQSHWNGPGITRDLEVKDVSENNDWSAVRVQLNHGGGFGSIYPTHGFIYPRPDQGVLVANVTHAAMPALDRAPSDLRHSRRVRVTEVAEAPESGRPLDLTLPAGISFDAPNRALR
jgi:surface antigen